MENFCDWYTLFSEEMKDDIDASRMSQADKDKYTRFWSFDPKTPGYCSKSNSEHQFSQSEKLAEKSVFQAGYWFIAGQGLGDHHEFVEDPLGMYKRCWDVPDWW